MFKRIYNCVNCQSVVNFLESKVVRVPCFAKIVAPKENNDKRMPSPLVIDGTDNRFLHSSGNSSPLGG